MFTHKIWFTSDQHFNHDKVLELSNRCFIDIDEMNETIIERWNKVVKPKDKVYTLGDFSFGNPKPFLDKLNGYKILIRGNHDKYSFNKALNSGFKEAHDLKDIKINDIKVTVCHYPMYSWNRSHKGSINLHGHIHQNKIEFLKNRYHVGVDTNNFTPIEFDEVYSIIQGQQEFSNYIF